ncbi:MAG TPA: hypothetical protein VG815_07160 [Chloroflexota bacterium]|jgi:hypothetical protein|nr:hypothetical protein [Chloroflexota bacterium]
MSRTALFAIAVTAGIVFIVFTVLAWGGIVGHHVDGPFHLANFKHGVLWAALAVVSFLFAAVTRPAASGRRA